MSDLQISEAFAAAQDAVLEVGAFLAQRYNQQSHTVELQGTHEKIQDDLIAENMILEVLSRHHKKFSYISEESRRETDSDITYVIDPIEGTSNYLRSIPFFATQIAILFEGELVAGLVYEPIKETLYHARKGEGYFVNQQKTVMETKNTLKDATISLGSGSKPEQKMHLFQDIVPKILPGIRSIRLYGSTGLELAYVAKNALQLHLNYQSKIYDYAAGVMLVREAGGRTTNLQGEEWSLTDNELLATNETFSKNMLKMLQRT